jgi:protein-disulfide isomerase
MTTPETSPPIKGRSRAAAMLDGAIMVVALVAMVMAYRTYTTKTAGGAHKLPVPGWQALSEGGQIIGPENAPVTMAVFSDFQCPYCARAVRPMRILMSKYPDKVKMVFHHFPLSGHPAARPAAIAAECAAIQGRFVQYHDALFKNQRALGNRTWESFAQEAGVADITAFQQCVAQNATAAKVDAGLALGETVGIRGTPTVYINGVQYNGTGMTELTQLVEDALTTRKSWWQFWK